jgi:hypothetical protein
MLGLSAEGGCRRGELGAPWGVPCWCSSERIIAYDSAFFTLNICTSPPCGQADAKCGKLNFFLGPTSSRLHMFRMVPKCDTVAILASGLRDDICPPPTAASQRALATERLEANATTT